MAKLRLAYGDKSKIETAIEKGDIPPGTLIMTDDSNEIYFYNFDCVLCTYTEKHKFTNLTEAQDWVNEYNCKGEVITVHEGDVCNVYVVDYQNSLVKLNNEAPPQVQADWDEEDPESPAYIKNKPDVVSGNDRHYVHTQISSSKVWDVIHSLDKYPAVSVVDSSGNLVVGDIKYLDTDRLMLTFTGAFSGKCFCN